MKTYPGRFVLLINTLANILLFLHLGYFENTKYQNWLEANFYLEILLVIKFINVYNLYK